MSLLDEFTNENTKLENKPISITGKLLLTITGGLALGVTVVCASFISPAFRKVCLPYVPATKKQIFNVLEALKDNKKGASLLDLGSGDGRIVIETAKKGFTSHGIELNPWLVFYSRLDALRKGLGGNVQFFRADLWIFNVSLYDNVVIFGVESMMVDLEKKLLKECNSNCRIVACRFPLPKVEPSKTIGHGIDKVWVYNLAGNKNKKNYS